MSTGDVEIRQVVLRVVSKTWPVRGEEELKRIVKVLTGRACREMGIDYDQVINFEWVVTQEPSEIDDLSWIPMTGRRQRENAEMAGVTMALLVDQRNQAKAYLGKQDGNIVAVGWVYFVA